MLHLDNIMTGQVTVQYTANFTTKLHGQNPFYIYFVATYFNVPVPRILMVRYQLIANANSSPNTKIICWWTLKLRLYNPCDVQFTFFGWWKLNRRLQYSIAPTCLLKPLIYCSNFLKPVSFHLWLPPSTECLPIDHSAPDHQSVCVGMRVVSVFSNWISPNKWVSQLSWVAPVSPLSPGRDIFYILHPTNWPWPHQGAPGQ